MAQGTKRDHIGIVISCLREFKGVRTMHSPCSYIAMVLPFTGLILLNNYTTEQMDFMSATLLKFVSEHYYCFCFHLDSCWKTKAVQWSYPCETSISQ